MRESDLGITKSDHLTGNNFESRNHAPIDHDTVRRIKVDQFNHLTNFKSRMTLRHKLVQKFDVSIRTTSNDAVSRRERNLSPRIRP